MMIWENIVSFHEQILVHLEWKPNPLVGDKVEEVESVVQVEEVVNTGTSEHREGSGDEIISNRGECAPPLEEEKDSDWL